jgi:hypothetical protein
MSEPKPSPTPPTFLTMHKCKVCLDNDNQIAFMDCTSEFLTGGHPEGNFQQVITCRRCKREIKRFSRTSQMFDVLGAFD